MYRFVDKYSRVRRELLTGVFALVVVFSIGTLWFWLIEGWPVIDAAYMTLISLSTVGFGEIYPLQERGRLFTMILILVGLLVIGYIVNRFTELLIGGYFEERIRLRTEKRLIDSLDEHYIVCGFGRMSSQVALEFQAENVPFVVIDFQPERVLEARELGYIVVEGDATLDESLIRARIDRAICIVTALPSDAENLYTVISAKTINPKIRAIARASNHEAVKKMRRAGADLVISPYITGGKRLAAAALRPQVVEFIDGTLTGTERSFFLEEFLIDSQTCPCVGKTLSQADLRAKSGALVLAIRRSNGILIAGPTGETILMEGDLLICMGTAEQLRILNSLLGLVSRQGKRT